MLAANGVGGLLGQVRLSRSDAVVGGTVGLAVIGLLYLTVASTISRQWFRNRAGAASMAIGGLDFNMGHTVASHDHLPFQILSQRIGADGLVAVVEGQGPGRAIVVSNQYILGSSSIVISARQTTCRYFCTPHRVGWVLSGLQGITWRCRTASGVGGDFRSRDFKVWFKPRGLFPGIQQRRCPGARARILIEDGRTLVSASLTALMY